MRRLTTIALFLTALVLPLAGCGKQQEEVSTPVACLDGPDQWLEALETIQENGVQPGEKGPRLGGETPISDCLPPDQPAGQQATVGGAVVEVASRLGRTLRAGRRAEGGEASSVRAAWQAGYLVGALERGAEDGQGIHATLVERVRTAASNGLDQATGKGKAAYQSGYEAGLESG